MREEGEGGRIGGVRDSSEEPTLPRNQSLLFVLLICADTLKFVGKNRMIDLLSKNKVLRRTKK